MTIWTGPIIYITSYHIVKTISIENNSAQHFTLRRTIRIFWRKLAGFILQSQFWHFMGVNYQLQHEKSDSCL
jgi:hypothetical protein